MAKEAPEKEKKWWQKIEFKLPSIKLKLPKLKKKEKVDVFKHLGSMDKVWQKTMDELEAKKKAGKGSDISIDDEFMKYIEHDERARAITMDYVTQLTKSPAEVIKEAVEEFKILPHYNQAAILLKMSTDKEVEEKMKDKLLDFVKVVKGGKDLTDAEINYFMHDETTRIRYFAALFDELKKHEKSGGGTFVAHQIAGNYYYPPHLKYAPGYGLSDGYKRERGGAAASLDYYDDDSDGMSGGTGYTRNRDRYYGGYKGSAKLGTYGDRSGKYKRGEGIAASSMDFEDYYYYDDSDAMSAYQADLDDDYYYVLVADEYGDSMDQDSYYDYGYDDSYKASAQLSGYDDDNYYGRRLDRYYGSKVKAKEGRNHRHRYGRRGLMVNMKDGGVSVDLAGLMLSVILFMGLIALFVVGYRYKMKKKAMYSKYRKMEKQITTDGEEQV